MENMGIETVLKKKYSGKKILITGHTGFKGSWLISALNFLGAEIRGYSLHPDKDSLFNLMHCDKVCQSVFADIRAQEKLEYEITQFQPDFIFHLAAQSLVRPSYSDPAYTFEVNSMGTVNVLNSIRKLTKPCVVIVVTTDKVYENREINYSYQENDSLGGYDPYSASKACAEIIASSFRRSFFNAENYNEHKKSVATARAGNVIGGGDWAKDRIIPDLINSLTQKKAVKIRNPGSIRPWQHVLDGLSGYLLLGAKIAGDPVRYSEAWNLGPKDNDTLTVLELVGHAIKMWGTGKYECVNTDDQPHEASLLKLDSTKAMKHLGWVPKYDSRTGIMLTIEWYRKVLVEKISPADITLTQIKSYFSI